MTRETKVGLLVGMGIILLIGIIISDHLSVVQQQDPAQLTGFAGQTQRSIHLEAVEPAHRLPPLPVQPMPMRPAEAATEAAPPPAATDLREQFRPVEPLPQALAIDSLRRDSGALAEPAQRAGQPVEQMARALPPQAPATDLAPSFESRRLVLSQEAPPQTGWPIPEVSSANQASSLAAADGERAVQRDQDANGTPVIHYVKKGETLYQIAQRYYGNGEQWRLIAEHNPGKVMANGHVNENVRLVIPNLPASPLGDAFVPVGRERAVRVDQLARAGRARTIEVKPGDTLMGLAAKHLGSQARWEDLLAANRDKLSSPEALQAGMTLTLPADDAGDRKRASDSRSTVASASASRTYTVRSGDTLSQIAQRVLGDKARWRDLYQANRDKLKNPDRLQAGLVLRIPG